MPSSNGCSEQTTLVCLTKVKELCKTVAVNELLLNTTLSKLGTLLTIKIYEIARQTNGRLILFSLQLGGSVGRVVSGSVKKRSAIKSGEDLLSKMFNCVRANNGIMVSRLTFPAFSVVLKRP